MTSKPRDNGLQIVRQSDGNLYIGLYVTQPPHNIRRELWAEFSGPRKSTSAQAIRFLEERGLFRAIVLMLEEIENVFKEATHD